MTYPSFFRESGEVSSSCCWMPMPMHVRTWANSTLRSHPVDKRISRLPMASRRTVSRKRANLRCLAVTRVKR